MEVVAQGVSLRVRRKKRGSRFRGNDIGIALAIAGIYA
jgi:hypothetical protein